MKLQDEGEREAHVCIHYSITATTQRISSDEKQNDLREQLQQLMTSLKLRCLQLIT